MVYRDGPKILERRDRSLEETLRFEPGLGRCDACTCAALRPSCLDLDAVLIFFPTFFPVSKRIKLPFWCSRAACP